MRTYRFASLAIVALAAVACDDSSGPTDLTESPDQSVAAAFEALDLDGVLADWIRRAPSEVPQAPMTGIPPADRGVGGPLAVHGSTIFLLPGPTPGQSAYAGTVPGGPCLVVDASGYYRWVNHLTTSDVDHMADALLVGDPVQAELATRHAHSGIDEGPGAYAEALRLLHWSFATGDYTVVAVDSRSERPIPHVDATFHLIDWDLPITSVTGWADQDSVVVEAFGVAAAADEDCDTGSSSITEWEFAGITPVVSG